MKKKICLFFILVCCSMIFSSCEKKQGVNWDSLEKQGSMKLDYADNFSVDYYENGYKLINISNEGSFLVVPENKDVPKGIENTDIVVLKQPLDKIYLAATSSMDLFRVIDAVGNVRLSGTKAEDWYIDEAKEAMKSGEMLYAGKYSAPDYETILSNECNLALESTMIYHSPEVKEQLERLEIPVMVERSSYETHPLGRLEWVKLYGAVLGKDDEACDFFEQEKEKAEAVMNKTNTGKTVAFFYVNSNGAVNVRKSSDYVSMMIQLAGGRYVFDNLESDNALSTMNMQMESFYAQAKDADYLIYNSTIDGELNSINDLLDKNELFKDFKAVKENNVWCTSKSMFQETTGVCDMIVDMYNIFNDSSVNDSELKYLKKLQ